ncbi:MAG: histidinol dehydrogenase [Acidimicrobiaceae bacterium]|nr:histidinol dehydrogenase [Acidimicrobiaceae bacterium]MDP6481207.1 histidinol dehydrogenase [Acidimicrobiales bacterium]
MLTRLDLRGFTGSLADVLPRPEPVGDKVTEVVRSIIAAVRERGDEAVAEFTERFDGASPPSPRIGRPEMEEALRRVDVDVGEALLASAEAVRVHHECQVRSETSHEAGGLEVRSIPRPVRRAGCYVPGGRATYPSTLLMTAVPARVAGVDEVVVCVPPGSDGLIPDATLAAAAVAGVDVVHPVGGAQAIAALTYGTSSIDPVDVIVGPGNVYVAVAKQEVAGVVGIPVGFAGPSEVVVIADSTVPPEFAAVDVVVQAEHGPDGLAWLITWDEAVAEAAEAAVREIVAASPRRSDIEATLAVAGNCVVVDGPVEALAVADEIAPEHLQLMCADAGAMALKVRNAGAVFCGPWSPASLGDYMAGPSHVLPTAGTARFAGALTVSDFTKDVHVVTADRAAIERLGPHIVTLAEVEGLDAHAESVRMRLSDV